MTTNELEKIRRETLQELEIKLVEEGLSETEKIEYKRYKNYDSAYYLIRKGRIAEMKAKGFDKFSKEEKLEFFSLVSQVTGYEKRLKIDPTESLPAETESIPEPEDNFKPSTDPSVIPSATNGSSPAESIHIVPDTPETPRLKKNIQLENVSQRISKLVELSRDEKEVGLRQAMEIVRAANPHEMNDADYAVWCYAITSLYELMQEMSYSRGIKLAEKKRAEIKKAEAERKEARVEKIRSNTKEAKTEKKKLDKKIQNLIDIILRSNGHEFTFEQLETKSLAELKKICMEVM